MQQIFHEPTTGHTLSVNTVAYFPDRKYCVSGSTDNTVRIWNIENQECISTLEGHSEEVNCVSVSLDAKLCVSGSLDKTVRVWDLDKKQCISTLEGHSSWIRSVSISSDGSICVSGSSDNTIRVWDLKKQNCIAILKGAEETVWCVSISPDGKRCVSCSNSILIYVWDLENFKCIGTLHGHYDIINSVCIFPDGKRCISGSKDTMIRIWDLEKKECIGILKGHLGVIRNISLSADGNYCVSHSSDNKIRVWDLETLNCISISETNPNWIKSISVSTDGKSYISGSNDKTVRVWDLDNKECIATLEGYSNWVRSVSISSDGKYCVSGSNINIVCVWNLDNQQCISTLKGHLGPVWSVSISSDGFRCVSSSSDNTIRFWDLEKQECIAILTGHSGTVWSVSISSDGKYCVSSSDDRTVRFWDLEKQECIAILTGHSGTVWSVSISSDGHRCVSGSSDNTVRVWDLKNKKCITTLEGHSSLVRSVSISSDGLRCVSGSNDRTIRVWDLRMQKCIATLEGHSGEVKSISISSNGKHCVSGSSDNTVRIWDLEIFTELAVWQERQSQVTAVCISPDSSFLIFHTLSGDQFWYAFPEKTENLITTQSSRYITAKIVLVGESQAGKTHLGYRLAHGEYIRHDSTHGQQFWAVDRLKTQLPNNTEAEVILWDFAGQPDYRLIHSLFLDDASVALLCFDPTTTNDPLQGLDFWLNTLSCGKDKSCQTILVSTKCDRGTGTLSQAELEQFCKTKQIPGGHLQTSAQDDTGTTELLERIASLIPWEKFPLTVTPQTYKRIKDLTLALKENSELAKILYTWSELTSFLKQQDDTLSFSQNELEAAVQSLMNHGYIQLLTASDGSEYLLLKPELLNNLAASFVLAARRHPRELGALEENLIYQKQYHFPELQNLSEEHQILLLDNVLRRFVERNIALRENHGAYNFVLFPELINFKRPTIDTLDFEEGDSYHAIGEITNLYASLVVCMGYNNYFVRQNQWHNQAQYIDENGSLSSFRQITDKDGERQFILYFGKNTCKPTRTIFQGLFEALLMKHNVTVTRYPKLSCPECKTSQERTTVIRRILDKRTFINCEECGERLPLEIPERIAMNETDAAIVTQERKTIEQHKRYENARLALDQYLDLTDRPSCFISYAWGDNDQQKWVQRRLAVQLRDAGFKVILDIWDSGPGGNIDRFIERIQTADYILVVGTEDYLQKYKDAEKDKVSVAAPEVRLINQRLSGLDTELQTVIPILRKGTQKTAFPPQLQRGVYISAKHEEEYYHALFDLTLTLLGKTQRDPRIQQIRDMLDA